MIWSKFGMSHVGHVQELRHAPVTCQYFTQRHNAHYAKRRFESCLVLDVVPLCRCVKKNPLCENTGVRHRACELACRLRPPGCMGQVSREIPSRETI